MGARCWLTESWAQSRVKEPCPQGDGSALRMESVLPPSDEALSREEAVPPSAVWLSTAQTLEPAVSV